jgi:hypothetical protein
LLSYGKVRALELDPNAFSEKWDPSKPLLSYTTALGRNIIMRSSKPIMNAVEKEMVKETPT